MRITARNVCAGARPSVLLRRRDNPGTERVEINVGQGRYQMIGIERRRVVASLPEVSAVAVCLAPRLGIGVVCAAYGSAHRFICCRYDDQMDVIRHEAEAENSDTVALASFLAKKTQVPYIVTVVQEYLAAVVSPLGDVVWGSGHYHAGCTRQGASIAERSRGQSRLTVPR